MNIIVVHAIFFCPTVFVHKGCCELCYSLCLVGALRQSLDSRLLNSEGKVDFYRLFMPFF